MHRDSVIVMVPGKETDEQRKQEMKVGRARKRRLGFLMG